MKRIIDYLVYSMLVLSSGAFIQIIKDGGAREQGFYGLINYSGWLNLLPTFWLISTSLAIGFVIIKTKLRYIDINFAWAGVITLSFLSVIWSEFVKVTFNAAIVILLAYVLVNIHVSMAGWRHVIAVIHKFFLTILIASLIAIILLPSYGVSIGEHAGKWQGVFDHKNGLGNFASLVFVFYMWWLRVKLTTTKLIAIGLAVLLVIGSGSSTALANITISTALNLLLHFKTIRIIIFNSRYIIVAMLAFIVVLVIITSMSGTETAIMDKDSSFSNRNLVWIYFMSQIAETPFLGHGIGQFGMKLAIDDSDFLSSVGFVVGSAHNGFIESWYALGVVGITFIVAAIISTLHLINDGHAFRLAFLFLFFLIISNMFESLLLGFNIYYIFFMYVTNISRAMSSAQDHV